MKLLLLACIACLNLPAQDAAFQVRVAGHGKPMILIPGLASSGTTWDSTVARYQDRFQCHVLTVAGFAGVPRVPAPMLDRVRDGVADYIRKNKLEKPVIVGHSLGGFVALDLAVKYPDLPGKLLIVDAYPFMLGASSPEMTADEAKATATLIRGSMSRMDQAAYEAYVKAGTSTRDMVTKDSDFQTLVAWGLASDRTAVADAMVELFSADLRNDLDKIKSPSLVLGAWAAYKQYTDHQHVEANLHRQYSRLAGVDIQVNDTSRHFIMWDDPSWMFAQFDRFLKP
jgi:pimeloyl-ACP methyl ester carboxylesterase